MDKDCIFCKIIRREIPANIFFENEEFLAFDMIEPVANRHTILIPKKHSTNLFDIEKETLEKLSGLAKQIASDLVKKHRASGVNLLHAAGKDAQQSVFHFHMHIVPRYENDNLDPWFRNKL